jgi:hypothetical protein
MALAACGICRLPREGNAESFCPKCHHRIFFEQIRCEHCLQSLAFDPITLAIRSLEDSTACSNRNLISCNWAAEERSQYCCSCALTRTIPNLGSSKNRLLWSRVEGAKRRLIYDLCRFKLPLAWEDSTRLNFAILAEDAGDGPIMTGHLAGWSASFISSIWRYRTMLPVILLSNGPRGALDGCDRSGRAWLPGPLAACRT